MEIYEIRKMNSALTRIKELLEETSVLVTAEDVDSLMEEEDEKDCSGIFPCGELGEGDEINSFLSGVIEQFVEQGFEEKEAEDLVFDLMEDAIESGALGDTPDVDASLEDKREWIMGFDRLLEHKLSDSN